MAGLMIVGSAAQFAQQTSQAQAQQAVSAQNRENALAANRNTLAQIATRTNQQANAAGQAITRVRKEAESSRATVEASAVEAGVKGKSVQDISDDFSRQEGEFVAATLLNEKFQLEAAELEKVGAQISTSGALLGSADVEGPDAIIAALQAGVGGLSAFNSAKAANQ